MGRWPLSVLATIACWAALVACGQGGGAAGRMRVEASTTQVADLVRQVGGRRVDVHQILRPNSDPHSYEPRPSDARALASAKVVFQSGGDVDRWLDGLIASAGAGDKRVRLIDHVHTIERKG